MILDVTTRKVEPDITVFEIVGRMTLGNQLTEVERSLKNIIQQGCRKLVLDISKLDFMDSSGVGVLVMCAGAVDKAGGQMRIAGANSRVSQVFEITQLERLVPVLPNAEAACLSFRDAGSMAST